MYFMWCYSGEDKYDKDRERNSLVLQAGFGRVNKKYNAAMNNFILEKKCLHMYTSNALTVPIIILY